MPTSEFVLNQLKQLPPDRELKFKGDWAVLRCPIHKNGQERTPSLHVRIQGGKYAPGTFRCFGCAQFSGNWATFAKTVGLDPGRSRSNKGPRVGQIFCEQTETEPLEIPLHAEKWPVERYWRNIQGWAVRELGGLRYIDRRFMVPKLFFPVFEEGELIGGVHANIIVQPKFNYVNIPGTWEKENWLFFDAVAKKLETMERRIIAITEGPRDAANLYQFGLPALPLLGTSKSDTPDRFQLLRNLDCERILVAMDPDQPGKKAAAALIKILKRENFQPVNLQMDARAKINGKMVDLDPSDLSEKEVQNILGSILSKKTKLELDATGLF